MKINATTLLLLVAVGAVAYVLYTQKRPVDQPPPPQPAQNPNGGKQSDAPKEIFDGFIGLLNAGANIVGAFRGPNGDRQPPASTSTTTT